MLNTFKYILQCARMCGFCHVRNYYFQMAYLFATFPRVCVVFGVQACGGVYTQQSGNLTSPYYPDRYPNNKECVYVIRQPEGSTITLAFQRFHIEASFSRNGSTSCPHDYLEVSASDILLQEKHAYIFSFISPNGSEKTNNKQQNKIKFKKT